MQECYEMAFILSVIRNEGHKITNYPIILI